MKLKDRVALITGAGRGIGKSIAKAFAGEGCKVVLTARSVDQIETVSREIVDSGGWALPVPCDVSSEKSVAALMEIFREHCDRLDILVNNAGISKRSKFDEYDNETWEEVMRVNLFGVYLCTRAALPLMEQTGTGRIININSIAGKEGLPFNSSYSASKHAVLGLTKSLAAEMGLLGYPGITVNAICPFFVETDMFRGEEGYVSQVSRLKGISIDEVAQEVVERSVQQRILEPEEIAGLAVYLASDDARGITGQSINICGGRIFH